VEDIKCSHPRPEKELKGFAKIELQAEEVKTITLQLHISAFSYWHPEYKDWFAENGKFKILVGSSSKDIHLKKEIELQ
jgi:beta-glucosidase